MSQKPLNLALVGLGAWGRSMVTQVQGRSPRLRFTHGVARRIEPVAAFAAEHGLTLGDDYDRMLADPTVDAVVLATPHSQHVEQVIAAARAGKHVFCEKPLSLSTAEAQRAADACREAGRVLAVGHNKRFWASMLALRDIVADGSLGQLLHVEGHSSNQNSGAFAAWREKPDEAPGGGLTGSGIHLLDALVSVGGPIAELSTQLITHRSGADPRDTLTALLRFANGMSGTFAAVRATPLVWRVHVFGDAGSVESISETTLLIRRAGQPIERREVPALPSVLAEYEAFARAIAGEAPFPIAPDQIVHMSAVCEAMLQGIARGQPVKPAA